MFTFLKNKKVFNKITTVYNDYTIVLLVFYAIIIVSVN
jgi:hypothetical protein